MKNIWLVTKREFMTNVKKRSFIIMTFLAPFLMVLAGAFIYFMVSKNSNTIRIGVIDQSKELASSLHSEDDLIFSNYNSSEESSLLDGLKDNEDLDAVLVIPEIANNSYNEVENNTKFYTNKNVGMQVQQTIQNSLESEIRSKKLAQLGISETELDKARTNVVFTITNIKDGQETRSDSPVKYMVAVVLLFFIYLFILIYGMRVMRGVIEEKTNRVIEIIISSLKPFDLMMGKILGTTLVAFFQFLVWMTITGVVGFLLLGIFSPSVASYDLMQSNVPEEILANTKKIESSIANDILQLNFPLILFTFLFYFLFGYIFYSAVLAAIGAAVDSETETQQFMPVLLAPLMIGFYGSFFTFENPDGPVAFWLSMLPITSPMAMVTRIPFGVPWWELILSMVIMVISVIMMIQVAARVYRIGILMYGKKTSWKEIWKWIKMGY